MSTLVVVDVQNYFSVHKAKNLPAKIASHVRESDYEHVLFVKFRNVPESSFHRILDFTEVTGSPATDLHPDVADLATPETTFEKTTYSAFKCQPFVAYLQEHNIAEFDVCGVSFDACVLATAFEAFDLGYKANVLDTLCSVSSVREDLVAAAETVINRNLRRRDFRIKRT